MVNMALGMLNLGLAIFFGQVAYMSRSKLCAFICGFNIGCFGFNMLFVFGVIK